MIGKRTFTDFISSNEENNNKEIKQNISKSKRKKVNKSTCSVGLNRDCIKIILSFLLLLQITLLDMRFNKCKLVCRNWYNLYHELFIIRGVKYNFIKKYDRHSHKPPVRLDFDIKSDVKRIYAVFKKDGKQIRRMIRVNKFGGFYVKGNSRGSDYKIIDSKLFENYGKSLCARCTVFDYCAMYGNWTCYIKNCKGNGMNCDFNGKTYTKHHHNYCEECKKFTLGE